MIRFYVDNPLGAAHAAPFEVKQMDFGWIGPAITATDNLFNRVYNWSSQIRSEHFNADEAEKQRDWEAEQADKSRQWQENMYNMYNSPSAMKRQYLSAGMNPSLVGAHGGVGASSPAPSSTSIPSGAGASISPLGAPVSHDVGMGVTQALAVNANVANQNADTAIKASKAYSDMLKSGVDKSKAYNVFRSLMTSIGYTDDLISNLSTAINEDYLSAHLANERSALEYQLRNTYGFKESKAIADKAEESVKFVISQTNLNKANYKNALAQAKKALSEAATNDETRQWLVKQIQAQAEMLEASKATTKNSFIGSDNILIKFLNTLAHYMSIGLALKP